METRSCEGKRIENLRIAAKVEDVVQGKNSVVSRTKLLQTIDRGLNRGEPLGIGYYRGFLDDESAGKIENHASLVVGRRINPNTNTCEYLIRNSWGLDGCDYMRNPRLDCQDGQVWIPKAELHAVINQVVHVE